VKSKILAELITDPAFVGMARKIASGKDIYKDLLQETFIRLNSIEDEAITSMHERGELTRYATVTMYRQFIDEHNPLNKAFKHLSKEPERWQADPSGRNNNKR